MDPLSILAGSLAGSLLSGGAQGLASYFTGQAQQEAEKQKRLQEAQTGAYQMKRSAINEQTQRQQSALSDLINSYRSILGGQ